MTSSLSLLPILSLVFALVAGVPTPTDPAGPQIDERGEVWGLGVPIKNADVVDIIPNSYIVVYNDSCPDAMVAEHQAKWVKTLATRNIGKRSPIDNRQISTQVQTFSIGTLRAMALDADDKSAIEINAAEEVAYIEADAYMNINALVRQSPATTGLARLSAGAVGATDYVFDDSAGQGITAFIVDTGLMANHTEFEGRAVQAFNAVNDVDTDEEGHGSHVAGTIGGATFGVAKKVNLVGVKVLDAQGAGTNSRVLAGMNFVAQTVQQMGLAGKSVMNMSLGGGRSGAINSAINAIRAAGCVPVVAAGNENVDAANDSPASAPGAITVGAIDQTTDARASFSNFGQAVDVFAPGVKVQSVGIKSTTSTATLSGTSMASPHVAGLVAYMMALENITDVDAVANRIKGLAASTNSSVRANALSTTGLIAFNGV
ncbi:hypothetical protein N0V82_004460 [Gnomoniopsis sp. IMI 355080]|nr:hypothetical protein N0V82_004460 [Gnomoniopsis sp. IMI 355080]